MLFSTLRFWCCGSWSLAKQWNLFLFSFANQILNIASYHITQNAVFPHYLATANSDNTPISLFGFRMYSVAVVILNNYSLCWLS